MNPLQALGCIALGITIGELAYRGLRYLLENP